MQHRREACRRLPDLQRPELGMGTCEWRGGGETIVYVIPIRDGYAASEHANVLLAYCCCRGRHPLGGYFT